MHQLFVLRLLFLFTALFPVISWAQSAERHTSWCFEAQTNNRLADQPLDRGNCGWLLTGGGAAAYFTGNGQLATLLMNSRQNQWAAEAAKLACIGGVANDQAAIRLIQACQCHNTGAQKSIENNQKEVLITLRAHGGCGTQQPPATAPSIPPSPPKANSNIPPECSGQVSSKGGFYSCPDKTPNKTPDFEFAETDWCTDPPYPMAALRQGITEAEKAKILANWDIDNRKKCGDKLKKTFSASAPKANTEEKKTSNAEERLRAAKSLYEKGLITEKEYEAKRSAILADL